jgi:hypothetical protein
MTDALPHKTLSELPLAPSEQDHAALVGSRLSVAAFQQLAGHLAGVAFVKIVVERASERVHFLNDSKYGFHADYIAERIMKVPRAQVRAHIDAFNKSVYISPDRSYYLGILSLHKKPHADLAAFFAFETVEVDTMDTTMLLNFFKIVAANVDASLPIYFKPANHVQEEIVRSIDPVQLPRMYNHELYGSADFVPLHNGVCRGRIRLLDEASYSREAAGIKWYDIVVMDRVPDSIPRISGIINAQHTTPLSHTNILASGWQIPNAVQIGIKEQIKANHLNGEWVEYAVTTEATEVKLTKLSTPVAPLDKPRWSVQQIHLETPGLETSKILPLNDLRMTDRYRYGTKAANLGELKHVLTHGSSRLIGFYRIPRPPRSNLLSYLAQRLKAPEGSNLGEKAWEFIRDRLEVPRGIALPFALQREFLESSPKIQQAIGKLKMALELNAKEIDAICLLLQTLIRNSRMTDKLRDYIDSQIAEHLGGVSSFVVRSSSNAEDLKDFSAAGIYESINHVTTAEKIFESIKEVWASLVSPRSVRLRHDVGISLDDCYMGVIIQEEVEADFGGVLVTTNPMNPGADFRNVFINASEKSAIEVVGGHSLPYQYLFNTVEGGGRTLSLGSQTKDLANDKKELIKDLAFAGRLLQSHFSQDYTFSAPSDIEWAAKDNKIFILQLRPYGI